MTLSRAHARWWSTRASLDWGKHPQLRCVARADGRAHARAAARAHVARRRVARGRQDLPRLRPDGRGLRRRSAVRRSSRSPGRAGVREQGRLRRPAPPARQAPTVAQRKAIGGVFDRCVGRASELAMWKRLLSSYARPPPIPCIARHSLRDHVRDDLRRPAALCRCRPSARSRVPSSAARRDGRSPRQRAATRTGAGARRSVSAAGPA